MKNDYDIVFEGYPSLVYLFAGYVNNYYKDKTVKKIAFIPSDVKADSSKKAYFRCGDMFENINEDNVYSLAHDNKNLPGAKYYKIINLFEADDNIKAWFDKKNSNNDTKVDVIIESKRGDYKAGKFIKIDLKIDDIPTSYLYKTQIKVYEFKTSINGLSHNDIITHESNSRFRIFKKDNKHLFFVMKKDTKDNLTIYDDLLKKDVKSYMENSIRISIGKLNNNNRYTKYNISLGDTSESASRYYTRHFNMASVFSGIGINTEELFKIIAVPGAPISNKTHLKFEPKTFSVSDEDEICKKITSMLTENFNDEKYFGTPSRFAELGAKELCSIYGDTIFNNNKKTELELLNTINELMYGPSSIKDDNSKINDVEKILKYFNSDISKSKSLVELNKRVIQRLLTIVAPYIKSLISDNNLMTKPISDVVGFKTNNEEIKKLETIVNTYSGVDKQQALKNELLKIIDDEYITLKTEYYKKNTIESIKESFIKNVHLDNNTKSDIDNTYNLLDFKVYADNKNGSKDAKSAYQQYMALEKYYIDDLKGDKSILGRGTNRLKELKGFSNDKEFSQFVKQNEGVINSYYNRLVDDIKTSSYKLGNIIEKHGLGNITGEKKGSINLQWVNNSCWVDASVIAYLGIGKSDFSTKLNIYKMNVKDKQTKGNTISSKEEAMLDFVEASFRVVNNKQDEKIGICRYTNKQRIALGFTTQEESDLVAKTGQSKKVFETLAEAIGYQKFKQIRTKDQSLKNIKFKKSEYKNETGVNDQKIINEVSVDVDPTYDYGMSHFVKKLKEQKGIDKKSYKARKNNNMWNIKDGTVEDIVKSILIPVHMEADDNYHSNWKITYINDHELIRKTAEGNSMLRWNYDFKVEKEYNNNMFSGEEYNTFKKIDNSKLPKNFNLDYKMEPITKELYIKYKVHYQKEIKSSDNSEFTDWIDTINIETVDEEDDYITFQSIIKTKAVEEKFIFGYDSRNDISYDVNNPDLMILDGFQSYILSKKVADAKNKPHNVYSDTNVDPSKIPLDLEIQISNKETDTSQTYELASMLLQSNIHFTSAVIYNKKVYYINIAVSKPNYVKYLGSIEDMTELKQDSSIIKSINKMGYAIMLCVYKKSKYSRRK